jgi:hypothetical protein
MATFDESIETDLATELDYQLADAFVTVPQTLCFWEAIELDPTEHLSFGDFFYTQPPALFAMGIEITPEELLLLAPSFLRLPSELQLFQQGIEIEFDTLAPVAGDTGIETIFGSPEVRGFPNMAFAEILYPVVPLNAVNKVLTKMDSQEWKAANKANSVYVQKRSIIRFRIDTSYLATFLGDLHNNRTAQFRLQTPGFTPFGVNSEDNYVRLLNYTSPIREPGGLTYLADVEFLFMAVFA